jgi:hypothetical protein
MFHFSTDSLKLIKIIESGNKNVTLKVDLSYAKVNIINGEKLLSQIIKIWIMQIIVINLSNFHLSRDDLTKVKKHMHLWKKIHQ